MAIFISFKNSQFGSNVSLRGCGLFLPKTVLPTWIEYDFRYFVRTVCCTAALYEPCNYVHKTKTARVCKVNTHSVSHRRIRKDREKPRWLYWRVTTSKGSRNATYCTPRTCVWRAEPLTMHILSRLRPVDRPTDHRPPSTHFSATRL